MLFNYNDLPDWQNVSILQRNRLAPRAFFVPYADREEYAGNETLERSSRVQLLDGEWFFRYFRSAMEIPEREINCGTEGYAPMSVPSCWQNNGIERPFYVNVPFPFPATPPLVPYQNPCGVYKRRFTVFGKKRRAVLSFLGVASAFSVYLNGRFAGYGEGSHMTVEFDVTEFLKEGNNDIAVLVFKWCNGSYLECQDMFRHNGIFRSVYLTYSGEATVWDIGIEMQVRRQNACVEVRATPAGECGGARLRAELKYAGRLISAAEALAEGETSLSLAVEKPILWSAELPRLYDLELSLVKDGRVLEFIGQPVGLKHVEIRKGVLYFNSRKIKLFGVNHHDTHPERGFALTYADMENDIQLMKKYNINAVRFSHYPPHPFMLYLCDRYGLYVIDEADIESHGELFMEEGAGSFSRDPMWRPHFADRAERLFCRDRNRCSVLMWSLGNESGGGKNHEYIYKQLKKRTQLLIHYEGARDYAGKTSDILSFMYAAPELIERAAAESERPVFLCEYAHCMGVGPGGVKEYAELFRNNDKVLGGCVWEWAEHAALVDGKLTYGGDNGEYVHDGNFCVDGMMSPYRAPTPSAKEIAAAYRPVRAQLLRYGLRLENILRFKTLELTVRFTLLRDGKAIDCKTQDLRLKAMSDKVLPLPYTASAKEDEFIDIDYFENGEQIGREQVCLNGEDPSFAEPDCAPPQVREEERNFTVLCGEAEYVFDKVTATVCSIRAYGKEFLNQDPKINRYTSAGGTLRGFTFDLIRCGIDNDMYIKSDWERLGLYNVWNNIVGYSVLAEKNCFCITVSSVLAPPKYGKLFDARLEYRFYGEGTLKITAGFCPARKDLTNIPKLGVKFELPSSFGTVEYYGYGEGENYPDFLEYSRIGTYRLQVDDMSYPYLKPQEGGNRTGVKRIGFFDENGGVALSVAAADCFLNFNAMRYDAADFERVRHNYELEKKATVNVTVDGEFGGIGSNSCGPLPFDAYQLKADKEKVFSFTIKPKKT